MADNREILPPQYDVNAKWDACIDLTVRRFVYSTLGGAVGGLLLFSQFFLLLSLLFFPFFISFCSSFLLSFCENFVILLLGLDTRSLG